jgi:hypothetical protein
LRLNLLTIGSVALARGQPSSASAVSAVLLSVFLILCLNIAQLKVSTFLAFILAGAVNTIWPNLIDFPVMLESMFTSGEDLACFQAFLVRRDTHHGPGLLLQAFSRRDSS